MVIGYNPIFSERYLKKKNLEYYQQNSKMFIVACFQIAVMDLGCFCKQNGSLMFLQLLQSI